VNLYFPIPEPFGVGAYPKTEPYDLSDPEPANWHMKITAECVTQIFLRAVCSGWLSAVPPWERVESEVAPLRGPDHVLPDTITLYLEPNYLSAPQAGPSLPIFFQQSLEQAGLGKRVRCYVYYNIDSSNGIFSAQVEGQLRVHAPFAKHNINSIADRREMFAKGHAAVWVNGGDILAQASAQSASVSGRFVAGFGVLTDTGLVDPVFFFEKMLAYLNDPSALSAFKSLFGTNWPFLAPQPVAFPVPIVTASDAVNAAQQRLFPAPALYEAKQRLSLTDPQWRLVGNGQKALYWPRLLRSSGNSTTGAPFVFNTDDMGNPFQLEAVTQFFMTWPEPGNSGPFPTSQVQVDLQDGTWRLVFIDPFQHPTLGNPPLPKPDYFCKQHTAANSTRCDSANPLPSPFNADTYSAVLFLVHHGEVKAWYRWSTYTCHKWECRAYVHCELASSVTGNQVYFLRSRTSTSKSEKTRLYINYGFILSDTSGGWYVPGRYYFRPGIPLDDGTAPYDTYANKSGVMIHLGETVAIDDTHSNTSYNGSGGCLVSPSFPKLRNKMIDLFWEDELNKLPADRETGPLFLRNRTNSDCRKIRKGDIKMDDGTIYKMSNWDGKIEGRCYVIRPDEPRQK